jgi:polar amino acid transport system substrate-binding protein
MRRTPMLRAGTALLALLFALTSCADEPRSGDPAGDPGGADTLVVGADIPYVPFAFGDGPDYQGMDMDLVREVGRRLGQRVEIRKTPFDTIFRDVVQGRFDLVAASVVITEERRRTVGFSLPYFNSDQSVMVKRGSPVTGPADLAGRRIGVVLGGTGEKWAKSTPSGADVRTYDVLDDAFKALAAGQVDAVVNDFPSSKYAERGYPMLRVVATIATGERYGLVFKPGSPLRARVDEALLAMRADGTFDRIYRQWFQVAPPADLLTAPTASPAR